jgi:hypothetical protein
MPKSALQTRVVLVLCDALTFDDLRDNRYPHLFQLAQDGAIGLMNTAVSGPKTPAVAVLTLAVGAQQQAGPTDELAYDAGELVRAQGVTAGELYRRETGKSVPPGKQIVYPGIADLTRRGLNTATLGATLAAAQPPRRVVVCGNADTDRPQRRAALLAIDAQGLASGDVALTQDDPASPYGRADANVETLSRYVVESDAALFVLQLGDTARLKAASDRMPHAAYLDARNKALRRLDLLLYLIQTRCNEAGAKADILLVSPYPDADTRFHIQGWSRLSPLLAFGPDFPPGLLTSFTTRTTGLIANVDVAPTLLRLLGCPTPTTMIGRPFHPENPEGLDGAHRIAALARKDFVSVLDAQAMTEVTIPLAAVCVAVFLGGLAARRLRGVRAARWWAWILVCGQNFPAAALLAPLLIPPTLPEYGLRVAAWMAGLGALCYLLARPLRMSPPVVGCLLSLILLVGDTLAGQPLIKDSLLSSNALSGVRYYGVGNEYLGVLLGIALIGGFAWLDDIQGKREAQGKREEGKGKRIQPVYFSLFPLPFSLIVGWAALAFLLGWPGLGANSGSLVVTTVAFGSGIALLMGRRPTLRLWIACVALGLLLSFAFSTLDAVMAREAGSHAGRALRAATHGRGVAYVAEIALRKLRMNLSLLFYPYLLLGVGGVALVALAARALIGQEVQATLRRRPWLARGLTTLPPTLAATLIFKDSGFVTLAYLTGGACILLLWYALTEEGKSRSDLD